MSASYISTPSRISIHAPHARRDPHSKYCHDIAPDFNPRAPCEARPERTGGSERSPGFQSTRPMRGATHPVLDGGAALYISIHAPHARRDPPRRQNSPAAIFQSTRPMRGATLPGRCRRNELLISIHAPHARRDQNCPIYAIVKMISIHAPHARRDAALCAGRKFRRISIHAPHARRDDITLGALEVVKDFNPRAPCEARHRCCSSFVIGINFNPRAPCEARQIRIFKIKRR